MFLLHIFIIDTVSTAGPSIETPFLMAMDGFVSEPRVARGQ